MSSPRKILIVGPSWVGDMVMAHSLYQLLAERHSDAELHVLSPAWSKPVLARMPEISRAIEQPFAHGELGFLARRALGRDLRAEAYTHAIVLPRSMKSALVPYFAAIPVRTGFRGEWRYGLLNDIRRFDADTLDQTVKRFLALGIERTETGLPEARHPALAVDEQSRAETLSRFDLDSTADSVALMPGAAYGPAKQWPLEYFSELAARLTDVGVGVWVLGSAMERQLGDVIVTASGARNLCGETSLAEAADLLSATKATVTNDSGLMHMAAAVGTYVVALYGSSTPNFTPPLTNSARVFYLDLECSPCFERRCPLGHFRCMKDLTVDSVCSAVITALGGSDEASESS